jgi:hypothetical protein
MKDVARPLREGRKPIWLQKKKARNPEGGQA